MSPVYPERKWIKEKRHHTEKRNLNRLKQISILARSIAKRNPGYAGQAKEKMPRNARSTRQTEDVPASNNVK
jgi:hypothetical protein